MLQEKNLDWFPRMQAMSLTDAEGDGEQNELRTLHMQLQHTNQLIATLSGQLNELREQVRLCYIRGITTAPQSHNASLEKRNCSTRPYLRRRSPGNTTAPQTPQCGGVGEESRGPFS